MPTRRAAIKTTALAGIVFSACPGSFSLDSSPAAQTSAGHQDKTELAKQILADKSLDEVHAIALDLLRGGLNAGTGYQTTWIRDMNTFISVALEVVSPQRFRDALITFCKFQGPTGDIIDCYIANPQRMRPDARRTPLAPGIVADKNTVESDQESSLVQAVRKYVAFTHDRTILDEQVCGVAVRERLAQAMHYVMTERFDPEYGLVWGGTTLDWGDVQPETPHGTVLDSSSHRAISIYANAMLLIAINDYLELLGNEPRETSHWRTVRDTLSRNIRKALWDPRRRKFIPHVYLAGSPFPRDLRRKRNLLSRRHGRRD